MKLGHWGQILRSWTKSPLDDYSFQDKQSHCSVKCRSHDLYFLLHKFWCDTEADSQALDCLWMNFILGILVPFQTKIELLAYVGHVSFISGFSDFALYLEDYSMNEFHAWDIDSVSDQDDLITYVGHVTNISGSSDLRN